MSELTSEKIAKALKGAGLSSKQRIEKAYEAWDNKAIFFPNKDEFLFEWIGSAFAKPNLKKIDDCCLLQLPYWNLLVDLLQHFVEKSQGDLKRSIPTVHVNFVSSLSTLLQLLYKQHIKNPEERARFMTVAQKCLTILLSDDFNLSYRPAFEHVSSAVDQVLESLIAQLDLCSSKNEKELASFHQLSSIAQVLFVKFDSQLILAANQKKVFLSIVEKSLEKLLLVRRRILFHNDTLNVSQTITNIICHSLFHADTVLEFTSVLKEANHINSNSVNTKQSSYIVKLFESLDQMITKQKDEEKILDTIDAFPVLLSAFLDAFRKKRNTSTSAMQDISRMAEFGMFTYVLNSLKIVKDNCVSGYLDVLCRLLQEVLNWNVYNGRNDDIAVSQLELLNSITDEVIGFLSQPEKYDQGLVLNLSDVLLQIDFSLIENRVQSLWPVMLNSEDSAYDACLKLAKSVLQTYSASRQIDVYTADLVTNIQKIQSDSLLSILKKPMFSRVFLNEFTSVVSKSMPVAQYLGTFTEFQKMLVIQSDEHQHKKQKKQKQNKATASWVVTLTTLYFVEFIRALKLSSQQLKNFESPVMDVYQTFIKPCIEKWNALNAENTILPALQVHSVFASAFFQVYLLKFNADELNWLAKSYVQIFNDHIASDHLISRLIIVTSANTMLQHAYYTTLLENASNDQAVELVNPVIDFVIEDKKNKHWYNTTQWDGSILGLCDTYTLKVACWKLLSDEWFESIVRFIDKSRSEKMTAIIHMSMMNDSNSTSLISVQLLNKTLLRSANFYEAKCFKNCNIPIILNACVDLYGKKLKKVSVGTVSNTVAQWIAELDVSKTLTVDVNKVASLADSLSKPDSAMEVDVKNTEAVQHLATLLKLILLFPNEYIEKSERPHIIYLSTLVDIWSTTCTSVDTFDRLKISLMCRTLQLKFFEYFSTHSVLGLDYRILNWILSSNEKWTSQPTVEFENHFKSIEQVTHQLDLLVLRKVILGAGNKTPEELSLVYFKNTLTQRTAHIDQSNDLTPSIHLLTALNSVLNNRKSTEADLDNIIYAKESIQKISQFIVSALESAETTITNILQQLNKENQSEIIAENTSDLKRIGQVLHLTRLVQNYAHNVGLVVDEIIEAQSLSETLSTLATPLLEFLNKTLSTEGKENYVVLLMTTDFIAAFCSILPRYQQVDTTKRVLSSVWFIYSLVFNTGDGSSLKTLSNAFASWIQSLTKEQYIIVLDNFVEKAEEAAAHRTESDEKQNGLVYLSLFSQLLSHCVSSEKGRLRNKTPSILLKLSLVAGKTYSLKFLEQFIKLLVQITGDQTFHMKDYDASIILSCLLQVAHPSAPERFKEQLDAERANVLFGEVCSVLSNLISQHKEQVIYMMPPFIGFVQSLFHCFKSSQVSLVTKRKHQDSPRGVPLLQVHAPLQASSAHRLARVLTTIPQKQHAQKNTKSVQSIQKILSKHTHSLLIEYFTLQANPTLLIVEPGLKSILTHALYDILDLCSEADRNFILSSLDGSGKSLFKDFYNNWKENHKYSGQ